MSFSAMTSLGLHYGLLMLTLSRVLTVATGLSLRLARATYHVSCHADARKDYGSVASCAEYTKLRSDAPASADEGEGRFQNGGGRKGWG